MYLEIDMLGLHVDTYVTVWVLGNCMFTVRDMRNILLHSAQDIAT